jgi:hypothetical protein
MKRHGISRSTLAPTLGAFAFASLGCTAGGIVRPDGSAFAPSVSASVTFQAYNTGDVKGHPTGPSYIVTAQRASAGVMTFSFDPFQATSSTNGPGIPEGNYVIWLESRPGMVAGDPPGDFYYVNPWVPLSYNGSCDDPAASVKRVPCATFQLILCDSWAPGGNEIDKYGWAYCLQVKTSGTYTTVGLVD